MMLNTKNLQLGNLVFNIKDPEKIKIEIIKSLQGDSINGHPLIDYRPIEISYQDLETHFHLSLVGSTSTYTTFEFVKNNIELIRIHKYFDENFFRVGVQTSVSFISAACTYVHELQNILDYCDFKYNEEQE